MKIDELSEDINQPFQFYDEVKDESWREDDDCSIVAIALVCGVSYEKANKVLRKNGKIRWGADYLEIRKSVNALGYNCRVIYPEYYLDSIRKYDKNIKSLTLAELKKYPDIFADADKQLWSVGNIFGSHLFAVINGKIEDFVREKNTISSNNFGADSNQKVHCILDVSKKGNKPNISNNALWDDNVRNIINNYDEFAQLFVEKYNEVVYKKYLITEKDVAFMLEEFYEEFKKNGQANFSIPAYKSWIRDHSKFIIFCDDNWNLSLVRTY